MKENPAIFNKNQLNAFIRDTVEMPDFIKADPVLERTYALTRQRMVEMASKGTQNMEGLWDARKGFDSVAEKQVGSLDPTSKEASVIKRAVLDTRRAVNDYVIKNTPNGEELFGDKMRRMTDLYEARGNIAEQNYKLLNKNAVMRWVKQNPTKAKYVGYLLTTVGLGAVTDYILSN